jgi:hypothetical protein
MPWFGAFLVRMPTDMWNALTGDEVPSGSPHVPIDAHLRDGLIGPSACPETAGTLLHGEVGHLPGHKIVSAIPNAVLRNGRPLICINAFCSHLQHRNLHEPYA